MFKSYSIINKDESESKMRGRGTMTGGDLRKQIGQCIEGAA